MKYGPKYTRGYTRGYELYHAGVGWYGLDEEETAGWRDAKYEYVRWAEVWAQAAIKRLAAGRKVPS